MERSNVSEFVFELHWKTLKLLLSDEGVVVNTPRETIRAAYANELLADENVWLRLLEARNLTSHTYNDEVARRVYSVIQGAFPEMLAAAARIGERLSADES